MPTSTRHADRKDLIVYLPTLDTSRDELIGHVVDLTDTGARLLGPVELEPGRELDLEIQAPCRKALLVRAVCRWSQRDLNPDFHASGLEFVELDEAARTLIGTLVHRNGFRG